MVTEEETKGRFNTEGWLDGPIFRPLCHRFGPCTSAASPSPGGAGDRQGSAIQTDKGICLSVPYISLSFCKYLTPTGVLFIILTFSVGSHKGLDLGGCCHPRSVPCHILTRSRCTSITQNRLEDGALCQECHKEISNSTKTLHR